MICFTDNSNIIQVGSSSAFHLCLDPALSSLHIRQAQLSIPSMPWSLQGSSLTALSGVKEMKGICIHCPEMPTIRKGQKSLNPQSQMFCLVMPERQTELNQDSQRSWRLVLQGCALIEGTAVVGLVSGRKVNRDLVWGYYLDAAVGEDEG